MKEAKAEVKAILTKYGCTGSLSGTYHFTITIRSGRLDFLAERPNRWSGDWMEIEDSTYMLRYRWHDPFMSLFLELRAVLDRLASGDKRQTSLYVGSAEKPYRLTGRRK